MKKQLFYECSLLATAVLLCAIVQVLTLIPHRQLIPNVRVDKKMPAQFIRIFEVNENHPTRSFVLRRTFCELEFYNFETAPGDSLVGAAARRWTFGFPMRAVTVIATSKPPAGWEEILQNVSVNSLAYSEPAESWQSKSTRFLFGDHVYGHQLHLGRIYYFKLAINILTIYIAIRSVFAGITMTRRRSRDNRALRNNICKTCDCPIVMHTCRTCPECGTRYV